MQGLDRAEWAAHPRAWRARGKGILPACSGSGPGVRALLIGAFTLFAQVAVTGIAPLGPLPPAGV